MTMKQKKKLTHNRKRYSTKSSPNSRLPLQSIENNTQRIRQDRKEKKRNSKRQEEEGEEAVERNEENEENEDRDYSDGENKENKKTNNKKKKAGKRKVTTPIHTPTKHKKLRLVDTKVVEKPDKNKSPSAPTLLSSSISTLQNQKNSEIKIKSQPINQKTLDPKNLIKNMNKPEQISDMYAECIKLAASGKITTKNTWSLMLIDYIEDVLKQEQQIGTELNFQRASCTLDASVQIYSSRVDAVHKETFKVLGGLCRSEAKDSEIEENNEENNNGEEKKEEKKRKKKSTKKRNFDLGNKIK